MRQTSRTRRQRLAATLALAAYLAGAMGLPLPVLPVREAAASGEEEFAPPDRVTPPVRHRCGCPVEDQRQEGCCCSQTDGGCCSAPNPDEPAGEDSSSVAWAPGLWAAGCQGERSSWLLPAIPVALAPSDSWRGEPVGGEWLCVAGETAGRLVLSCPDPPPRSNPA